VIGPIMRSMICINLIARNRIVCKYLGRIPLMGL
jgi:hypothetical protein